MNSLPANSRRYGALEEVHVCRRERADGAVRMGWGGGYLLQGVALRDYRLKLSATGTNGMFTLLQVLKLNIQKEEAGVIVLQEIK